MKSNVGTLRKTFVQGMGDVASGTLTAISATGITCSAVFEDGSTKAGIFVAYRDKSGAKILLKRPSDIRYHLFSTVQAVCAFDS